MKDTYRGILRRSEWRGPFALTASAPSGRRPWPIRTTSHLDNYVTDKPIAVEFTYPVTFIPVGKKARRIARVRDRAFVVLRSIDKARVELACRIRPISILNETQEVVHFDRNLWWALPGEASPRRFAAALNEGEHAAVGLLDPQCVSNLRPATSKKELNARKIVHDGRDECVARLQRGAEGILLLEDRVFLRDGPPLYSLWNRYVNNHITAVGTSAVVVELHRSRRNPAFEDASNELVFGRLFSANDRQGALDFAASKRLGLEEDSTVEALIPELLHRDPLKIQLEATQTKLLRLISIFRVGTENGFGEIRAKRSRLRETLERDATVSDLGQNLKEFLAWIANEPGQEWKKKFRVERLFVTDAIDRIEAECARRGEPSPFSKPPLSAEEDAAIAGLST